MKRIAFIIVLLMLWLPAKSEVDLAFGAYQRGDYATALKEALKRIEATKDASAMMLLSELYEKGLGVKADETKSLDWLKAAAENKNREAMRRYGQMLLRGEKGTKANPDTAKSFLLQASQAGDGAASYALARETAAQGALPTDTAQSRRYLELSASQGHPPALYDLALARESEGDWTSRAQLLQKAYDAGLRDAGVEYAIALFNGRGVEKNERKAAEIFELTARSGSVIAQNRLGRLYANGLGGLEKNIEKAALWHFAARLQGLNDPWLDKQTALLSGATRTRIENEAKRLLGLAAPPK